MSMDSDFRETKGFIKGEVKGGDGASDSVHKGVLHWWHGGNA